MSESRRGPVEVFAAGVVRLRWVVVAFWVAAAVAVVVALPTIRDAQVGALGDLVPNDAEAIETERRSAELFAFPLLSRTLVVQRDPDGLTAAQHAEALRLAVELNRGTVPVVGGIAGALLATNALGQPPFSREDSTTAIFFLFFPGDIGQLGRTSLARHFAARELAPQGDFVGVTGAIPARYEQSLVIQDALPLVELATVLLVALAVGLHFRAIGAPLVNLLAVGVSYVVSVRVIAWIGERVGVSVPVEVEPVIVVLLFGVVTDYSIFFFSRARRRRAEGEEPRDAVRRTTAELTPIIATCGLTVAAGSAALIVARLGFFQAFGPGMAMAVLVALVVALTLVPAALAIGGRAIFWPRAGGEQPARSRRAPERGVAGRVVRLAVERPWPALLVCAVLLGASATGLARLEVGNPLMRALPVGSEPRTAYAQAGRGFAPGILSPTVVVAEGEGITRQRAALARLQRLIRDRPGIAEVVGPGNNPTRNDFGAVLSPTGDAARFVVVLDADPLGSAGIAHLRALRDAMPRLLREARLRDAEVSYAGDTALAAETIEDATDDLVRVIPLALLVVLLILVVFLRSLVAPLYLVAAATLAPLAALGLAAHFFQGLLDYPELTYYVPVAGAVLLLALGSDYNVFVMGRVWAEARTRSLRQAVIVGGAGAARAVAAAGLVLAGSFALLALVPLAPFRELAFVMAVGLLIEAFVIRSLLIPAVITVVGYRSGWPGRRLRRIRRRVSGQAEPRPGREPAGGR